MTEQDDDRPHENGGGDDAPDFDVLRQRAERSRQFHAGMDPRTQGERIRWIRTQIGPRIDEPMARKDFAEMLYRLVQEGDGPRSITTLHRWEADDGRGPTLKEGVVMARLVGRTAEWLSALDEYKAAKRAERSGTITQGERDRILKQGHKRGAVERKPPNTRPAASTPETQAPEPPRRRMEPGRGTINTAREMPRNGDEIGRAHV